jgi:hypothetical protein
MNNSRVAVSAELSLGLVGPEAPAAAVASFLRRTFRIVPAGQESLFIDFDAELTQLLSQA